MGGRAGDVLAAAWPAAVDEILARVATIEDAVAALLGGALGDAERDEARRAAHRLASTLGTFGIASGSVIARELETAFETAPAAADAPALAERALALRRSVESAPPPAGADAAGLRVVLAGKDIAVAVLVDHEVDRVALVRAGARRLIAAAARPEAVVREVAELDRGRRGGASTVLAVDDDPIGLAVLRAALDGAGYDVDTLGDPLSFWPALERSRPDLVVLDVQMPGADGVDLCRGLRADPRWRELPVLFLTATTSPAVVAELFAVGGDDYIPKPVKPQELVARVAGRLERIRQVRAAGELDDLTGPQRRPAAEPQLERLLALGARLGHPFALVALSIDGAAALAADDRDSALAVAGQAGRDVLRGADPALTASAGVAQHPRRRGPRRAHRLGVERAARRRGGRRRPRRGGRRAVGRPRARRRRARRGRRDPGPADPRRARAARLQHLLDRGRRGGRRPARRRAPGDTG